MQRPLPEDCFHKSPGPLKFYHIRSRDNLRQCRWCQDSATICLLQSILAPLIRLGMSQPVAWKPFPSRLTQSGSRIQAAQAGSPGPGQRSSVQVLADVDAWPSCFRVRFCSYTYLDSVPALLQLPDTNT